LPDALDVIRHGHAALRLFSSNSIWRMVLSVSEGICSSLWWKLRYQFKPNSLHDCPYFVRERFEDGRFNHVAMNGLQFGRH